MESVFLSGQPRENMRSHAAFVIVLLSLLAVTAGAAQQPLTANAQSNSQVNAAADTVARDTKISIQLNSNGNANWNVSMWFPINDENQTRAFEVLADDFEQGELQTGFNADLFRTVASRAESHTGRSMEIRNVSRSVAMSNDTGRLTLTFTWTNFAEVNGEEVVLGDVFRTDSGTWLSSLSADQQLVIKAPPGYGVDTSPNNIGVSNGMMNITGPRTFEPGELSVTYIRGYQTPVIPLEDFSWANLSIAILLLTVTGVSIYVWRRQKEDPLGSSGGQLDESDTVESTNEDPPASVDSGPAAQADDTDDDIDESLLSDEERVERLLTENDGRMMQANIVSETNWSNAKVSQLLSAMAEDGRINKLRIGRENLITLPDEDVGDLE